MIYCLSKVEKEGSVWVVLSFGDYGDGAVVTGESKTNGEETMMTVYGLFKVLAKNIEK